MKPNTKKLITTLAVFLLLVIVAFVLQKYMDAPEPNPSDDENSTTLSISTPTPDAPDDVSETPSPTQAADPLPTDTPTPAPTDTPTPKPTEAPTPAIDKDGWYYSKDEVALYIYTYQCLPSNYITKKEAEALGWTGGSVQKYKKGAAIGGSSFGNFEGILPAKKGRKYYECDIDTNGASSRGAKRIIYSNDGLIYYTDDHYETFTLLYGEE